jgi:hypothetical protein
MALLKRIAIVTIVIAMASILSRATAVRICVRGAERIIVDMLSRGLMAVTAEARHLRHTIITRYPSDWGVKSWSFSFSVERRTSIVPTTQGRTAGEDFIPKWICIGSRSGSPCPLCSL